MKPSLGPLTTRIINAAEWAKSTPDCPSSQKWADEFERVLSYAAKTGAQFSNYFNRLTSKSYSQFDSSLAELRVACFLDKMGLPVSKWEPSSASGNAGEFIVSCPSGNELFVEVKSPGWEGEVGDAELKAGRAKQPKYEDMQGGCVTPQDAIKFAIRKAYKKFDPSASNLLVIVDDLWVSLSTAPDMFADLALYATNGSLSNSTFENLGGIGIFWVDSTGDTIDYRMRLFLNGNVLPSAAVSGDVTRYLSGTSALLPGFPK